MKYIYQLVGFLLIFCIIAFSVLFFIESNTNILTGDFGDFVRSMHILYEEVKETILSFMQESGIANNAADLMNAGADKLRGKTDPQEPETIIIQPASPSPAPTSAPMQVIIPVITARP